MITEKRKKILEYMIEHRQDTGWFPTVREIGARFGIRSTNGVYEHLKALERDGYISMERYKARSINIKFKVQSSEFKASYSPVHPFPHSRTKESAHLPILGEVAAGEPIFPVINEGETITLPAKPAHSYVLNVRGDSMADAGIQNGDMVMVETGREVKSGDIVVALIDDEVTLKRLILDDGEVVLKPENKEYQPIKVGKRPFRILGRATTLVRKIA